MKFDLHQATLIKRYKRFLADVTLSNGHDTTIHCANTGAMTGCGSEGDIIYYSQSDNPKRKYPFSWEFTQTKNDHFICVNTQRANQLVEEALNSNAIEELTPFNSLKREVKYGNENSKIDFLLHDNDNKRIYIEVKSVTLLEQEQGYFPDTVTSRGQKHLRELIDIVKHGERAVLIFAVLHSGIKTVKAAAHIDKHYAQLLKEACSAGVEIIAYRVNFEQKDDTFSITLSHSIKVIID